MNWRFWKKLVSPDARTHKIIAQIAGGQDLYDSSILRRRPTDSYPAHSSPGLGMWVRYGDRTGIITGISPGDNLGVAIVNGDGTTEQHIRANGHELRQAYYDEIPPCRRPPADTASSYGYHRP